MVIILVIIITTTITIIITIIIIIIMIILIHRYPVTPVTCFEPWFDGTDSLSPGRLGGGKPGSSPQSGPALSITILSHPSQSIINQ